MFVIIFRFDVKEILSEVINGERILLRCIFKYFLFLKSKWENKGGKKLG